MLREELLFLAEVLKTEGVSEEKKLRELDEMELKLTNALHLVGTWRNRLKEGNDDSVSESDETPVP